LAVNSFFVNPNGAMSGSECDDQYLPYVPGSPELREGNDEHQGHAHRSKRRRKVMLKKPATILVVLALAGCGHMQTTKVGLMSFGDLEGKMLPEKGQGRIYSGKACGYSYRLSDAVRDALKGTEYDTIINAEVANETGLFVWNNCITVNGEALDSKIITASGGVK
jgi:hypothetical protein